MKKKNLTFKDVYRLPLFLDQWYPDLYVWCNRSFIVFDNLIDEVQYLKKIVAFLNSEQIDVFSTNVSCSNNIITIDGKQVFEVRGWGHLTSFDELNLTPKEAAKIQDDFANWVVNKLKGIEE